MKNFGGKLKPRRSNGENMGQGLAEKAVVGGKIRLTSICSRIATARFLNTALPAKLGLVGTRVAGPQSAEMRALGPCLKRFTSRTFSINLLVLTRRVE
jgi:hypothetical protein